MVILLIVVFCAASLLFGIIFGLAAPLQLIDSLTYQSKDTKLPLNGNTNPAETVTETMTEAMLKNSNVVANIPHPTADNG